MVNLEGKVKTALLVKVMKEWARCTYQWNVQNTQLLFRNQLYWEPRTVSKLKLFFFFYVQAGGVIQCSILYS